MKITLLSLSVLIWFLIDSYVKSAPNPTPMNRKEPQAPIEFIKHFPTADQTNGIDIFFVRLCAQIAADVYHKEPRKISQFETLKDIPLNDSGLKEPPKAVIYDNNAPFTHTNPPFVAVVAGNKLILGWRGSQTLVDAIRDTSFYMSSSSRWKNVAKVVKAHAGSLAAVEDSLVVHEAKLLEVIDDYNITEILLTGHSLGGGIAQVAQLWLQGTMDEEIDPTPNKWKELAKNGLTVKCMSFEGMSTTVYAESPDNELNQKGIDFINKCGANVCVTAFSCDVVPMCIGRVPDFGMAFARNVMDTFPKSIKNPLKRTGLEAGLGVADFLVKKLVNEEIEHVEKIYFPIAKKFQHIGKVLYYASLTAKPKVYMDNTNGILVDKEREKLSLPDISELKYEPTEKDALAAEYWNHGVIISSPGLAFYRTKDRSFVPYPK